VSVKGSPGSTWLVVLRADALEGWLKANHPGIQRKGPKGYKSLCNSDTSLVAYLRWCTHGVEIGAVDRAFVVSAATGTEAAAKGLKEFNAATAKMYQPLHSMAIERVLPGPVYVAEIYDRETSAVEYEPFTPASKDELLRGVQERASQYDEGFDLKVAGFSRSPAALGRRFIEGTPENIDFARNRVDTVEAAEDDVRDQMDEVSGMVAGPGFAVGLPQPLWSPAMLKAYAKGDENAFDEAYLELKSRARTEGHADQVRKSMLPELSKAAGQRKLTGNPYKAVIPIVSGIAYIENPIPELVKGGRTPYLRYTRDWERLAPQSRDQLFVQEVAKTAGVWEHEIAVFRALGSGLHWVGVMYWFREEMEDYTLVSLAVTLQSGRSWAVAENKVLRWIKSPQESKGHYDETGAGQVTFLRWVFDHVRDDVKLLQDVMATHKGTYAPKPKRMAVGWGDPKRERAYAYLTRLGFKKVADSGDGAPAYILDIEAPRQNPKKVPDVPVEATVRSERIGTKTRELTPGVHVVAQISRTGKEVWITHGEQRLFLYLQDDQGRGSLFYQSFAGTGGKAQGYWFPSGGILAGQRGRTVWVIKGNPKTDPGAGRAGLLALYEKANAVLPQSDAETDAFVKKVTGVDYEDLMYKDEYEIQPTMKILEEGHANALQSKWSSWAYRFWALNALDKTFGKRTFTPPKSNPLVGFERVPWKPGMSPRSEATFLSTAYPRLWEEALKNTALKIRVLVARDSAHMGEIGKNIVAIDAAAKRAGEIVILLLVFSGTNPYSLESSIEESKPKVGEYDRLSRPSPFMILHNLAEALLYVPEVNRAVMRKVGPRHELRISIDPARVDTWAGRRGALVDEDNAIADLFAKYVTTGKVAYNGTGADISAIKKHLDVMVNYLKRNPGVYEILSEAHKLPASDRDLKSLVTPAWETMRSLFEMEELFLNNPKDLAGRHVPERYVAGLPTKLQQQRLRELTQSRDDYWKGDYSELPTDRIARKMGLVKQSQYTTEAKKRGIEYRGDLRDMASRVLRFYGHRPSAREVEAFAEALRKSFSKGLAAWKSGGHRPGASPQNWAIARVNSLVVGGKTSWTADKKLFEVLPATVRTKIESMRQPIRSNPLDTKLVKTAAEQARLRELQAWIGEQVVEQVLRTMASAVKSGDKRYAIHGVPEASEEMVQAAATQAMAKLQERVEAEDIERLMELSEYDRYELSDEDRQQYFDLQSAFEEAVSRAVSAGKSQIPAERAKERIESVSTAADRRAMARFERKRKSAISMLKAYQPLDYVPSDRAIASVMYENEFKRDPEGTVQKYKRELRELTYPRRAPLQTGPEGTVSAEAETKLRLGQDYEASPASSLELSEEELERKEKMATALGVLRSLVPSADPAKRRILIAMLEVVPEYPDDLSGVVAERAVASRRAVRAVLSEVSDLALKQLADAESKKLELKKQQLAEAERKKIAQKKHRAWLQSPRLLSQDDFDR